MQVPSTPMTGKSAKVSLAFNDGTATVAAMTLVPSYSYNGETLVDEVYTIGTGRLINSRPKANPFCYVNGIVDGADVSSTVADEIAVTAGNMLISNVSVAIVADTSVAIVRPAATQARYVAIVANSGTGVVTAVAGTDTTAGTGKAGLLATFGAAAGAKPLIAANEILICYLAINATAGTVASDEMQFAHREWSSLSYRMLPSNGAIIISEALPKLHTGGIARSVFFSGKYWEATALANVGDAQQWSVTPNTSSVSAVTFTGGPSESQVDNWSFSFNQLFTDAKALDAIYNRQGYAAVKLELASGHYFLFVGSFAGGISVEPGSFIVQQLSGSIQDRPYWSGQ